MQKRELEAAVRQSTSYRQVAKRLGTTHPTIKKAIEEMGINVSHFDFGRRTLSHVGKTVNRLTIREVFKHPQGRWFCRCDCACGSTRVERRLDGVLSGHVPSCGCAYRNRPAMRGEGNAAFTGCGEILGSRLQGIRRGAERRGLSFEVSKEYLWALYEHQEGKCALSGVGLRFGRMHFSHETTASLDRIDSTLGYLEGNVQWVHKDVNKIKRDLDQRYFLSLCRQISDHNHRRTPSVLEDEPR
jgi:hypothetical protein